VAKDHSAKAVIWSSLYGDDVNVLLSPGEERHLPIIELPKDLDAPIDTARRRVCFVIYWRKTSSSWLRQVPIVIWTSTRDIERIANAATAALNQ
jgi:hypothetical protein